jgi:beta-lactam-binding protein with PASTA domain
MRCLTILALTVAATSCATIAKGVHYERAGNFAMPDVHGLTPDEAKDELAKAGITGSVSLFENYTCDDPSVAETRVCVTAPRAGAATSARIPVTLYLKTKATPSFTMPDVMGKTADEARTALLALGQHPERILVETLPGGGSDCIADRICRQSPSAGNQAWVTGPVLLQLGSHDAGTRRPPPPDARTPDARKPDKPDPQKPPSPRTPSPIF